MAEGRGQNRDSQGEAKGALSSHQSHDKVDRVACGPKRYIAGVLWASFRVLCMELKMAGSEEKIYTYIYICVGFRASMPGFRSHLCHLLAM